MPSLIIDTWNGKKMTDFGGGVIPKELYNWIRENLEDGKTILEFGSGEGTKALLEHYKVISVEHDKRWIGYAKGSHYIYAPLKNYGDYSWYDISVLQDLPKYDLILVDGPPGYMPSQAGRYGFIRNSRLFDMSVPIILDDTHRIVEMAMVRHLATMYKKTPHEFNGGDKKFTVLI